MGWVGFDKECASNVWEDGRIKWWRKISLGGEGERNVFQLLVGKCVCMGGGGGGKLTAFSAHLQVISIFFSSKNNIWSPTALQINQAWETHLDFSLLKAFITQPYIIYIHKHLIDLFSLIAQNQCVISTLAGGLIKL